MRTAVKRLGAHKGRRLSRNPDRQQDTAVEGAAAHRVIAVIGQPDRVVGRHVDAVGPGEDALAPGAQQISSRASWKCGKNVDDGGDCLDQYAAGRSCRFMAAITGPFGLRNLSPNNRIVMKLIHLTGAAAVFTVFALTAPSWLSPAMAQGAPGKMSELPSGLKYTDSKLGDGAAATAGQKVNVDYTRWIDYPGGKSKKFDGTPDGRE